MIPPLFLTVPDYWIGVLIEERLTFASYTGIWQLVFLTVIIVFHLKKVAFEGLKMFNRSCRKETWEYDALCTLRCNLTLYIAVQPQHMAGMLSPSNWTISSHPPNAACLPLARILPVRCSAIWPAIRGNLKPPAVFWASLGPGHFNE